MSYLLNYKILLDFEIILETYIKMTIWLPFQNNFNEFLFIYKWYCLYVNNNYEF